jgi:error-prone DNA polymerase
MPDFTHLHVASAFSAHYGTARPETLVAAQKAAGAWAAAITDRDGLYGAVRHIRACVASGLQPIVGVDLALRESDGQQAGRLTLLAHGHCEGRGWASMARAITAAHARSTRSSPPALARGRLRPLLRGPDGITVTILLSPSSDVGLGVRIP